MNLRAFLQIDQEAWDNRNPNTFHQLLLLKLMLGSAILVIMISLYVTFFVRGRFDHIFALQSLMWITCFVSYFRVRHERQVYKASHLITSLLTGLLLVILNLSGIGDISGAYHHVVAILVAASFLMGPRFALPYFLVFIGFYIAIASGLWTWLFPSLIPTRHPYRTSLYMDRILEITAAYVLAWMFDRMKISQQKRLKEQEHEVAIKEKQLSINRMAGGIAHEINNPLTILLGYLELLERHDFNKKDLERINPRIQMAAKRIQFVVWSLNQVNNEHSRKAGTAPLEKAIQDVQLRIRDLNPKLTQELDRGEDIKIKLPAEDLQNILYTLLENAVEALAGRTDGIVRLKVLPMAESVQIEVWDNGSEVNVADLAKFTEPFYTSKLDRPGRGMGLALASTIIQAVGGQLHFRREADWTVATMILPAYNPKALQAS